MNINYVLTSVLLLLRCKQMLPRRVTADNWIMQITWQSILYNRPPQRKCTRQTCLAGSMEKHESSADRLKILPWYDVRNWLSKLIRCSSDYCALTILTLQVWTCT